MLQNIGFLLEREYTNKGAYDQKIQNNFNTIESKVTHPIFQVEDKKKDQAITNMMKSFEKQER